MKLLWATGQGVAPPEEERHALERLGGLEIEVSAGAADTLAELRASSYDVLLTDFPLEDWSPEEWLEEVQRLNRLLPVLIRDADASLERAVRLTRLGLHHYFGPDAGLEELARAFGQAVEDRRQREAALFGGTTGQPPWKRFLVGESRAMRNIAQLIQLVGPRRCTVVVTGETGTGKEMVARAIHLASGRAHLSMVAVNCNALPDTLLEAELFGHVKGAFTGAISQRIGRFEQAHRSTLFLDEIGDMALDLQAKLLRVLQERELQRIGSSENIRLDVRVIAATNMDLVERIRQGKFREDLFYRLNVVPVRVPPLRERAGDVPLLVRHFLDKICREEDTPPKRISREALDRLSSYSWPGNVRQLENAVEMALALSGDSEMLYPSDFPLPSPGEWKASPPTATPVIRVPEDGLDFEGVVSRIERSILEQALQRTGGNKKMAAEMLRLKRTTLSAKLKSLAAIA